MNIRLLSRILAQPWAIQPRRLSVLTRLVLADEIAPAERNERSSGPVVKRKSADGKISRTVSSYDGQIEQVAQAGYIPLNDESWSAAAYGQLPPLPANCTVLMVWGVLGRAWTAWDRYCLDAIDVDDLTAAIAAASPSSTVVLWFRSPGGIITGIPETAAALRDYGSDRRLLSFTDDLCASAAEWLSAQCERCDATPTAEIGSIGVYCAWYDWTEYLANAGIKLELFRSGDMKGEFLPGKPLSDSMRQNLDEGIQQSFAMFKADVLMNRDVPDEAMQGQTLNGPDAKAANLVDKFYPSAADYFAALAAGKV